MQSPKHTLITKHTHFFRADRLLHATQAQINTLNHRTERQNRETGEREGGERERERERVCVCVSECVRVCVCLCVKVS